MNATGGNTIGRGRRFLVLAVMCTALATVVSAVSSLNVALPDIARDINATSSDLQWIVDAYAIVFAGLLLLFGAVGDRLGRRPVLLAGLAIFSASAAIALFIDSSGGLIAIRAFMGLGAAAIMPSTLAIITNVFPPDERDRAVAIWAGVAGASALLGLLASGALLEAFAWQSVFAFSSFLGLFALVASALTTPNSTADEAALDIAGGALSVIGLSTIVYGVIEGPERGWTDPLTMAALALGIVVLGVFLVWELRRERPLLDPRLFRLRGFAAGTASITVQFFAFFGFVFVTLQYMQFVLDYSPLEAGVALSPMAVAMMGLSPRVPRLVDQFGPARVGPTGLLLMAAGFMVFSTVSTDSNYLPLFIALCLLGTGLALATTPATTAIVSSLPANKQGVASAVNDAAREVGGALGIAVLGSALSGQYKSGISSAFASYPSDVAERAKESLPAALGITHQLGADGVPLAAQAQSAFVDGFALAMYIAAASTTAVATFVFLRAPRMVRQTDQLS